MIPLVDLRCETARSALSADDLEGLGLPRIPLISVVDDDRSVRLALAGLVESLGYRVETFESAEAFLAAPPPPPDCLITDIQMPGVDGIALKARLDATGARVPVILVTARTEPALLRRARDSGAAELLSKPFSAEDLLGSLERALAGQASGRPKLDHG